MKSTKQSSLGDKALTGTVTHVKTGDSVGIQSPSGSDTGEVVIPADHRYPGGVAGGE